MRRIVTLIAVVLLATTLLNAAGYYYVAINGKDTNPGTLARPFKTLMQARDAIRALSPLPTGGVTVYLKGGYYALDSTFALDPNDSGTASKPIKYAAYQDQDVHIHGGIQLKPEEFTAVPFEDLLGTTVWPRLTATAKVNVKRASLGYRGLSDLGGTTSHLFVYVDGEVMTIARSPDLWFTNVSPTGGTWIVYDSSLFDPNRYTGYSDDLWVRSGFGVGWKHEILQLSTWNATNGSLKLATAPYLAVGSNDLGRRFFVENALEDLDEPGEFWIDRTASDEGQKYLYLWPKEDLVGKTILVSHLTEPLLTLTNVAYTSFTGITFECGRYKLITMTGGSYNWFNRCTIRNCDVPKLVDGDEVEAAVDISGSYSGLSRCIVSNTSGSAIKMGGGVRSTLTASHNYIRNCDISNWGMKDSAQSAGIWLRGGNMAAESCGGTVANNHLHDAPAIGIWLHGNNHVIHYNEIDHICTSGEDMGAIYAGVYWTDRGNSIQYNYIHDIESAGAASDYHWSIFGVYLDENFSDITVSNNIFYRIRGYGILHRGGHDCKFENNLFMRCGYGGIRAINNWDDSTVESYRANLNAVAGTTPFYYNAAWTTAYPRLLDMTNEPADWDPAVHLPWKDPSGCTFKRAIGYGMVLSKWLNEGTTDVYDYYEEVSGTIYNSTWPTPFFTNEPQGNLNLDSEAVVPDGWLTIPFGSIGIRR